MIDVSIVIPTFNRAHLIPAAIESCLAQGIDHLQIVVVDDASSDNTSEVLSRYGDTVEYYCLPSNQGAQKARNKGLEQAKGEFVKFLDSDDTLVDQSLLDELQLARINKSDILVSDWLVVSEDGYQSEYFCPTFGSGDALIDDVLSGKGVFTSAALYRRDYLLVNSIVWDETLSKLQDWDFFSQAALSLGRLSKRNGFSYHHIQHGGARISNASMLENALEHHKILAKLEQRVRSLGKLSAARAERLAAYYFKELQVLRLHDVNAFERALERIEMLAPNMDLSQAIKNPYLAWLSRLIGVRRAMSCYALLKKNQWFNR